jgi:RNA polymerase sigma factor for flagellar operon FliA
MARRQLIASHVEMARRIALRVARRIPVWLSQDDLISAAMVGLTEAAARYEDGRNEPFVAFAEKRIRGAVLDELRRGDLMPRGVRTAARQVGAAIRDLEQELKRPPEDEEIAKRLGVPLEKYLDELEGLTHVGFVELPDDAISPGVDWQGGGEDVVSRIEKKQLSERLCRALRRLPERDARLLALYYNEELSYAEIGEVLQVSESRVCQLHARACARLRVELDGLAKEA